MKCNPFFKLRNVLLLLCLTLLVLGISRWQTADRLPDEGLDNNPQQFQLRATGTNYSSTFIDDPRAADKWRLRTANGAVFGRIALPGITNGLPAVTN
jgi:hypothetical protein